MKRTVFFILLSCCLTKGDYDVKCSDRSKTGLTFEPSSDGVEGRYKVEWCTTADKNVTAWELVLRYDDRAQEHCVRYQLGPLGALHSRFHQPVNLNMMSCTNVCFTTNLDLIFNGTCYHVKTLLRRHTTSSNPHESLHYVINPYNKEHFTESKAMVYSESDGEDLLIHWYLGYVPATEYSMDLCTTDYMGECEDVTSNCTSSSSSHVSCAVRARYGCYTAHLHHTAPWTAAEALFSPLINTDSALCHRLAAQMRLPPAREGGGWWAAGVAAAVCLLAALAALVALAAWRVRSDLHSRKRVLWAWLSRSTAGRREVTAEASEGSPGLVVLLYARDCEAMTRAAAALRELVARHTGARVLDVYSSAAVAASAAAAAAWLRALLRRDDVRVLLLQTPAAQQLHCPALRCDPSDAIPTLSAPLMARRAAARRPHAGDALLALALTELSAAPAHPRPYRKYYVAEISGLKAEVVHSLTPLRRYVLPDAALTLLNDLSPLAPDSPHVPDSPKLPDSPHLPDSPVSPHVQEALRELNSSIETLRDYIRDNPDYLSDELIFI